MRHRIDKRKLGRPTSHRMLMLRNLVTDLLRYNKITTTEARAKETRSLSEKMITLGIEGSLYARRRALAFILDKNVVEKLFSELASRYKGRQGGYTRILKLGNRVGDAAPRVLLELVS